MYHSVNHLIQDHIQKRRCVLVKKIFAPFVKCKNSIARFQSLNSKVKQ